MPAESLPFTPSELALDYRLFQPLGALDDPLDRFVHHWTVTAGVANEDGTLGERVGWVTIVIVEHLAAQVANENPYELLDAEDGDLETIGAAIFDPASGELAGELADMLGSRVMIADRCWIDPRYRGHGLGPLVAGTTMRALQADCGVAACYPAPFEGDLSAADREQAVAGLTRTWATLGFEPFRDGVMVLDLTRITFDEALGHLWASLLSPEPSPDGLASRARTP